MRKLFLALLVFCVIGFFNLSKAQVVAEMTAKDFFSYEDYNRALVEYLKLYKEKKDDLEINFNIGFCYLQVNDDRTKAIPFLEFVYNKDKTNPEVILNLGLAYMYKYDFDKATSYFNEYRSKISPKKYELVDHYIENCENSKVLIKNPVNVTFENLGKEINSKFPDYYPFVTDDESTLYFTSRREGNARKIKSWQGFFTADIYFSKVSAGQWARAKNIGALINTSEDEECVYVTPDGKNMIIYVDNTTANISGDIFLSTVTKNKTFQKPVPFNTPLTTKDPELEGCITEDLNMMIVASDREGGLGETDLYMFRKLPNGEWGIPVDLGPNVNTQYTEAFPVFDEINNVLYFSSEGHTNMGGFDIFKSKFNPKTQQFEKAVNIGYPINTPEDNMEFTMAANNRDGYLSAVRKDGFGDLDIYKVTFNDVEVRPSIIKGIVSTMDTIKKDIDAFVTINDAKTNEELDAKNVNSKSGKYIFAVNPGKKYFLNVTSPGYQDVKEEIVVYDKSDFTFEIEKNIVLRKPESDLPPAKSGTNKKAQNPGASSKKKTN